MNIIEIVKRIPSIRSVKIIPVVKPESKIAFRFEWEIWGIDFLVVQLVTIAEFNEIEYKAKEIQKQQTELAGREVESWQSIAGVLWTDFYCAYIYRYVP